MMTNNDLRARDTLYLLGCMLRVRDAAKARKEEAGKAHCEANPNTTMGELTALPEAKEYRLAEAMVKGYIDEHVITLAETIYTENESP